jgi:hypothetical protein
MGAINPLPKSSVESKQRKRKSRKSEILSGTPYKNFADSKEKASKMKGKSERQQKRLEAAQKKEKPGGLKSKKQGKTKTESLHAVYFNIFINRLCRMWTDIL